MEFSLGASLLPGLPAFILPVVLDRIYQHFTPEYHSSTGTIKKFQIALFHGFPQCSYIENQKRATFNKLMTNRILGFWSE